MSLLLKRIYKANSYTIGDLYIDGVFFCNTLEDKDRGLKDGMTIEEINKIKIHSETAIPTGIYKITLDVVSPRFAKSNQYSFCGGKLPRLLNVKGFEGILIHIGNTAADSAGCILVGENKVKGQVINSTSTFKRLYEVLKEAKDIEIEIV